MAPDGWRQACVGDAVESVSRVEPVAADQTYRLLGVRWYGRGCHLHATHNGAALKTPMLNRVMKGDVTCNKMWVTKGAFAVVPLECDGSSATTEYPLFTVRKEVAHSEFLQWAMNTPDFVRSATDASRGSTSRKRLNPVDFLKIALLLPPIDEQRKIAQILFAIDRTIKATHAIIEQLQQMKKAVMAELLTRGLPGRHTRFVQTEFGEVPSTWTMTNIGELGSFSGGNGFRPSDWSTSGLPIIRIQNLNASDVFNYFAGTPDPSWLVEAGELLFAWAGTRGASFGPCIWPGPQGVLDQHIYRIAPSPIVRKWFLYYVLRIVTQAVEKRAHGFKESLVHLRKAELTGWPVALPSLEEQDEIVAVLTAMEDRHRAEQRYLDGLIGAQSALAHSLLNGTVRVTSKVNEA